MLEAHNVLFSSVHRALRCLSVRSGDAFRLSRVGHRPVHLAARLRALRTCRTDFFGYAFRKIIPILLESQNTL